MSVKKILGIVLFICGIAMIAASLYIKGQVEEGKQKVSHAQKRVDQGNSLFSLNPATKQIGKGITDSVQKKIDEGEMEIAKYEAIASQLQIGGIVVAILGIGLVFIGGKGKKSSR